MTEAERLAHVLQREMQPGVAYDDLVPAIKELRINLAQRIINSGVVIVTPPPDPAEQIAAALAIPGAGMYAVENGVRRALREGWFVPGPRCDQ